MRYVPYQLVQVFVHQQYQSIFMLRNPPSCEMITSSFQISSFPSHPYGKKKNSTRTPKKIPTAQPALHRQSVGARHEEFPRASASGH